MCGKVGHIRRNCHKGRIKVRRIAMTAILFRAVDKVNVVVGRDAAVGLTGVVAAVEIKQQRVMPPL